MRIEDTPSSRDELQQLAADMAALKTRIDRTQTPLKMVLQASDNGMAKNNLLALFRLLYPKPRGRKAGSTVSEALLDRLRNLQPGEIATTVAKQFLLEQHRKAPLSPQELKDGADYAVKVAKGGGNK